MEVRGRGGGWGEKDLEIVTEQLVVRSKGVKRPVPPGPLGLPPIIPLLLSLWNSALKGAEPCLGRECPRNTTQPLR